MERKNNGRGNKGSAQVGEALSITALPQQDGGGTRRAHNEGAPTTISQTPWVGGAHEVMRSTLLSPPLCLNPLENHLGFGNAGKGSTSIQKHQSIPPHSSGAVGLPSFQLDASGC